MSGMKDVPEDERTWSAERRRWDQAIHFTNAVAKRTYEGRASAAELSVAFERESQCFQRLKATGAFLK